MKALLCGALVATALLSASALAQDKSVIRFANVFDGPTSEKWEPVLEAFHAAHPDIEVKSESVAGSGAAVYPDVLRTSMASGDPPDVFFLWGGSIAKPFINAGQVEPIDAVFAEKGWGDRFPAWTIDRLKQDGKQYGVPFHGQGMGFFYRKDVFEANGVTVPTTYAELEAACTKLKSANIYCASTGGKFGWHVMRLVDYFLETACGPEVHDQLNALAVSWDQPCVVDAYTKFRSWIDNGWLVPDFLNVAPDDSRISVYQGQAAMILEGPWFEPALVQNEQDVSQYGFFLPPTDHEPSRYSAFPEQFMIASGSKHKEAAATFIDFITKLDTQQQFPDAFGASATVGLQPDCAKWPLSCQITEIVQSDRPAYPPTDQAFEKELMDSFFEVQDGIVAGKLTPAEGAKLMQQRAEAWKAKS
jgi:raffinose/stachyose/melibiose transport system substrate-binding protein